VQGDVVLEVIRAEHGDDQLRAKRPPVFAEPQVALVRPIAANRGIDDPQPRTVPPPQALLQQRRESLVLLDFEAGDEGVAKEQHPPLAGGIRWDLRPAQAE
jgi:hypothetical protein